LCHHTLLGRPSQQLSDIIKSPDELKLS
jgi:hypothetical protein